MVDVHVLLVPISPTENVMACKCAVCGTEREIPEDFMKWPEIPGFKLDIYPITENAKPTGKILSFVCARCLRKANKMRTLMKGIMSGVEVSDHAVSRYIERTKSDISDTQTGKIAVLRAFSKARKIRFRSQHMLNRLANHDFAEADYYWLNELVFVVGRREPRAIVTVEKLWGKKLNEDFFLDEDED